MNVYRITSYHCDENGKPFGEPFQHIVYTDELMETYKNKKYVEKIAIEFEEKIKTDSEDRIAAIRNKVLTFPQLMKEWQSNGIYK